MKKIIISQKWKRNGEWSYLIHESEADAKDALKFWKKHSMYSTIVVDKFTVLEANKILEEHGIDESEFLTNDDLVEVSE